MAAAGLIRPLVPLAGARRSSQKRLEWAEFAPGKRPSASVEGREEFRRASSDILEQYAVYEATFVSSTLCRDVLRAADHWLDSGGQAPIPAPIERPDRGGRRAFGAASAAMRVAQAIRAEPTHLHVRQRRRYRSKAEIAARFAFLAVQDARSAIGREAVRSAVRDEVAGWVLQGGVG